MNDVNLDCANLQCEYTIYIDDLVIQIITNYLNGIDDDICVMNKNCAKTNNLHQQRLLVKIQQVI